MPISNSMLLSGFSRRNAPTCATPLDSLNHTTTTLCSICVCELWFARRGPCRRESCLRWHYCRSGQCWGFRSLGQTTPRKERAFLSLGLEVPLQCVLDFVLYASPVTLLTVIASFLVCGAGAKVGSQPDSVPVHRVRECDLLVS